MICFLPKKKKKEKKSNFFIYCTVYHFVFELINLVGVALETWKHFLCVLELWLGRRLYNYIKQTSEVIILFLMKPPHALTTKAH